MKSMKMEKIIKTVVIIIDKIIKMESTIISFLMFKRKNDFKENQKFFTFILRILYYSIESNKFYLS